MKKFIISDLHGNGNIYNSVLGYLKNYKELVNENVTLYINGDLIDRGEDSATMLLDVYNRITNGSDINMEYLAGNHELMMYQASLDMRGEVWPTFSDWFWGNGGEITAYGLEDLITFQEEQELIKFISNLKIYHKFDELIKDKNIVLVHAKCPNEVEDICDVTIKDNNMFVEDTLWTREIDFYTFTTSKLGNDKYFSIIGHTPVKEDSGFKFNSEENYLNIDGGCAPYAKGMTEYNHSPLVEILDGRFRILTFNNNNEIIQGNYFDGTNIIPLKDGEMEIHRNLLDKKIKPKKLVLYDEL